MIPSHLPKSGPILRKNAWGQAYRLTEDAPQYDGSPESVHEIVNWLGVEHNARWTPKGGTTYCNVYAHDLCNLLGAYVPRVWWSPTALALLDNNRDVQPVYASTVFELSANALFRWLVDHSAAFGWRRTQDMDEAQNAANRGHAVVICSRRKVEAAPGHISVVVAESARCMRSSVSPVQSQAGGRNMEVGLTGRWWAGAEMAEWGAWIHDPLQVADTDPLPPPPDTQPDTPTSKSSQGMRAVNAPIVDFEWRTETDARPFLETLVDEDDDKGAA